ncbi:hypothetical protein C3L33_11882, partial [Rhododendron williamsianum]
MNWEGVLDDQGLEFQAIAAERLKLASSLATAMHIPWLWWMFPLEEEAFAKHGERQDRLARVIMEEHSATRHKSGGTAQQHFVDALLTLREKYDLSEVTIIGLLWLTSGPIGKKAVKAQKEAIDHIGVAIFLYSSCDSDVKILGDFVDLESLGDQPMPLLPAELANLSSRGFLCGAGRRMLAAVGMGSLWDVKPADLICSSYAHIETSFISSYLCQKLRFKLPPGPRRLPIIGNLFDIKPVRFQCFAEWAQVYGPIISVWTGSNLNVVVSSPELAREVLKENDQHLANRHRSRSVTNEGGGGGGGMVKVGMEWEWWWCWSGGGGDVMVGWRWSDGGVMVAVSGGGRVVVVQWWHCGGDGGGGSDVVVVVGQ